MTRPAFLAYGLTRTQLVERLLRDRYSLDQLSGHGMPPHCERCYRQGWNDSSANAVRIVESLDPSDDGNAATPAARDSSDGSNSFTEAEYRDNAARVVAHAAATGRAVVVREDGSVRVVISIPTADMPIERGLAELVENAPEPELKCCPRFTWGDGTHDLSCEGER